MTLTIPPSSELLIRERRDASPRGPRSASSMRQWLWAALGVAGGAVCGAALVAGSGDARVAFFDHVMRKATVASSYQPAQAFGASLTHNTASTKMLSGVSGEIALPLSAENDAQAAHGRNISPAAWDRLSAGNCITLTTKSGQTLSFSIVGARPAGEQHDANTQPEIDLAITTCSGPGAGEPVAKAVIEPAQPPAKGTDAQRAL